MFDRKLLSTMIVGAMAFGLSSTAVLAQENSADQTMQPTNKMQQHDMKSMHKSQHRKGMQGRHKMPATVTSVDKKTGLMKVDSAGMQLTVHFPPPAVADVNKGDKITLMLGFHKGDMKGMHKDKDHMMKDKSMTTKDSMDHEHK